MESLELSLAGPGSRAGATERAGLGKVPIWERLWGLFFCSTGK